MQLSNYPSVCLSSGLKGQSKGQPGVQVKGSGSQPKGPRASLRDLRVIIRGLRTRLRRSQLGIKARGVEGFGRVGQMNKQNFSLFHRALPLMGPLSKKPAKLDLVLFFGIVFFFGDG